MNVDVTATLPCPVREALFRAKFVRKHSSSIFDDVPIFCMCGADLLLDDIPMFSRRA